MQRLKTPVELGESIKDAFRCGRALKGDFDNIDRLVELATHPKAEAGEAVALGEQISLKDVIEWVQDWLRNSYQDHNTIDALCAALKRGALSSLPAALAAPETSESTHPQAEAEARPVGELPPLPEPVKKGAMDCEDCDGRGGDGEWHYQGEFQPPEQEPCSSCNGSGRWKLNLYTGQQMCDYARQALSAAPREVAGWKFAPAGDAIKVTDPSGLSWWVCDGMPQERPHSLGIFLHPLFATLAAAAPQEGTT
jgi:hypothetical protein